MYSSEQTLLLGAASPALTLDPPDEEALVRSARHGDERSFAVLVERYQRRVLNLLYRISGDEETALDLSQEAFVHAYRSLGQFEPGRPLGPWLLRIATNLAFEHWRRERGPVQVSMESLEGEELAAEAGADPGLEAERHELDRVLEGAVQSLSPLYRTVLWLRLVEGLSYEAIAETLRLPLGTVKTRLHRARDLLRSRLVEEGVVP
ncbi:MAG: sigma-70 family RNA polymerase sigma factor [Anaerolineales bacterium]|jgi:RNA polymerase sigma-70 factor (ECF subfamily)